MVGLVLMVAMLPLVLLRNVLPPPLSLVVVVTLLCVGSCFNLLRVSWFLGSVSRAVCASLMGLGLMCSMLPLCALRTTAGCKPAALSGCVQCARLKSLSAAAWSCKRACRPMVVWWSWLPSRCPIGPLMPSQGFSLAFYNLSLVSVLVLPGSVFLSVSASLVPFALLKLHMALTVGILTLTSCSSSALILIFLPSLTLCVLAG